MTQDAEISDERKRHDDPEPMGPTSVLLTLLAAGLWGATPVAISYSVDALPPLAVAAVRFAMAAVFLFVWCRMQGVNLRPRGRDALPILVLSALLFFQIWLFNLGVQISNSSHGSLLINTFVFWVAAIGHFITRTDRLALRHVLGLASAGIGAGVLLWSTGDAPATAGVRDQPTVLGDAILVGSAFLLGIKIVYTKHVVRTVAPLKLMFWHHVIGTLFFTSGCVAFETVDFGRITGPAAWALVYQGVVVAGLCYTIQAKLLKRHSASQVSVYSFATPVFGIVIAVVLRNDPLTPWLFASSGLIAGGVYLVTSAPSGGRTPMPLSRRL